MIELSNTTLHRIDNHAAGVMIALPWPGHIDRPSPEFWAARQPKGESKKKAKVTATFAEEASIRPIARRLEKKHGLRVLGIYIGYFAQERGGTADHHILLHVVGRERRPNFAWDNPEQAKIVWPIKGD